MENMKADFQEQKAQIERLSDQKILVKDQKITDLTIENTSLRQRLLTVESAMDEFPLIDAAENRSVMWLHITYTLIVFCLIVLLLAILWIHANLRENVRMYMMLQSRHGYTLEKVNADGAAV